MAGTTRRHFFIPAILGSTLRKAMDMPLPRVSGRALRVIETLVCKTPLPRLWSRQAIMPKVEAVDFAAAGEPAPFYCPPPWSKPK
jgi:hypothetical protein